MNDIQDLIDQDKAMSLLTNEANQKSKEEELQIKSKAEDAYFLLVQIYSHAQATQDKVQLENDLEEWKKRYLNDLEFFPDEIKRKIQIMLSKEFQDEIIKGFTNWIANSNKNYEIGLKTLKKIITKAEHDKDKDKFDKALKKLYSEYPEEFLKEKYPHIFSVLTSKANLERIFQKFDSELAYDELTKITENPSDFKNKEEFVETFEQWKELFPTADFNDKYKSQVEKVLQEFSDDKKLDELFPIVLDLSQGEVVPTLTGSIKQISKDALHDFINIVGKNAKDVNSLFDWTFKYSRYMNSFEPKVKEAIVLGLQSAYGHELPTKADYRIPSMQSIDRFKPISQTKKDSIIQLLGILTNNQELTNEDIYQLGTINNTIKDLANPKAEQNIKLVIAEVSDEMAESFQDSLVVDVKTRVSASSTSASSSSSSTSSGGNSGGGFSAGIQREQESKPTKKRRKDDSEPEQKNEENIDITQVQQPASTLDNTSPNPPRAKILDPIDNTNQNDISQEPTNARILDPIDIDSDNISQKPTRARLLDPIKVNSVTHKKHGGIINSKPNKQIRSDSTERERDGA